MDTKGQPPREVVALARFEREAPRLFASVAAATRRARDEYEQRHGQVDDETAGQLFERAVVCVEHERFIPCRVCMYTSPAWQPYRDDPASVAKVRRRRGLGDPDVADQVSGPGTVDQHGE